MSWVLRGVAARAVGGVAASHARRRARASPRGAGRLAAGPAGAERSPAPVVAAGPGLSPGGALESSGERVVPFLFEQVDGGRHRWCPVLLRQVARDGADGSFGIVGGFGRARERRGGLGGVVDVLEGSDRGGGGRLAEALAGSDAVVGVKREYGAVIEADTGLAVGSECGPCAESVDDGGVGRGGRLEFGDRHRAFVVGSCVRSAARRYGSGCVIVAASWRALFPPFRSVPSSSPRWRRLRRSVRGGRRCSLWCAARRPRPRRSPSIRAPCCRSRGASRRRCAPGFAAAVRRRASRRFRARPFVSGFRRGRGTRPAGRVHVAGGQHAPACHERPDRSRVVPLGVGRRERQVGVQGHGSRCGAVDVDENRDRLGQYRTPFRLGLACALEHVVAVPVVRDGPDPDDPVVARAGRYQPMDLVDRAAAFGSELERCHVAGVHVRERDSRLGCASPGSVPRSLCASVAFSSFCWCFDQDLQVRLGQQVVGPERPGSACRLLFVAVDRGP